MSCPSARQCTVIEGNGEATTFDPGSPSHATSRAIDHQFTQDENSRLDGREGGSVACPSIQQCTAIDGYSDRAVTFDPTSPPQSTLATIKFKSFTRFAIACPSASECVVTGNAAEVTFEPVGGRPPSAASNLLKDFPRPRPSWATDLGYLAGVSCPSARRCVTLADSGEVAFDPTRRTQAHAGWLPLDGAAFDPTPNPIACPNSSRCAAIDTAGDVFTFDPASIQIVRVGAYNEGPHGDIRASSVACATSRRCVVLGYDGAAWVGRAATKVVSGCPIEPETSCNRADLAHANLIGVKLSHAQLERTILRGADLTHADLSGANLGGADLRSADLARANLSHASLAGAKLRGADFHGARFCETIMPNGSKKTTNCR